MESLYQAACDEIDDASAIGLNELSQEIWRHPELKFQEVHAHRVLTDFLENHGLDVERQFVLETGFRSVIGSSSDGPHVAILCEYDALPEIGHACGHNLVAEAGVAAGIGVNAAFRANGKPLGKLTILGTPAAEDGGGKIDMINAKVFEDVDVALMAQPAPFNAGSITWLAFEPVTVTYHGKITHGSPWHGINALDAAVLCYQNVACMKQQFKPTWRVMGIIKNGGSQAGVITELSELEFHVYTPTKAEHDILRKKLDAYFLGAATATGCTVEISWAKRTYYDVINNSVMEDLYLKHAKSVGIDFHTHGVTDKSDLSKASTDMGNVSYLVPSINPVFYIGTSALNHTREFGDAAGDLKAQPYTLAVAKALAMTAIDILTKPETLQNIKEEFAKTMSSEEMKMLSLTNGNE